MIKLLYKIFHRHEYKSIAGIYCRDIGYLGDLFECEICLKRKIDIKKNLLKGDDCYIYDIKTKSRINYPNFLFI